MRRGAYATPRSSARPCRSWNSSKALPGEAHRRVPVGQGGDALRHETLRGEVEGEGQDGVLVKRVLRVRDDWLDDVRLDLGQLLKG